MKKLFTNKLSRSIFIFLLIAITIITYQYLNDKDAKSMLYYIIIYLFFNLLSTNNLLSLDVTNIIDRLNQFCIKNWVTVIIFTLFVIFCENYVENKEAIIRGFNKGYNNGYNGNK
jgi:hypothetical protein